jgi:hypothetical protein
MAAGPFAAPEIGRHGSRQFSTRHGWRNESVKGGGPRRSFGLSVVLALCLAPALVAGCASATPAASSATSSASTASATSAASDQASPSAAASSNTFASRLYGYGLVVPLGWQTQMAESPWISGGLEGRCPSDWDCFTGPSGEPTLAAAAASVPADLTLHQWRLRMKFGLAEGCVDSAEQPATTLGGEPAETWTTTCQGEGLHSTKVVALHGGRGYIVLYASPIDVGLDADRAALSSILITFRFAAS